LTIKVKYDKRTNNEIKCFWLHFAVVIFSFLTILEDVFQWFGHNLVTKFLTDILN